MQSPHEPDAALAALLKSAGLRVTATRLGVLRALSKHPHADTEAVIADVHAQLGSVSPQTVYSVLAAFVAAGIVRRIEPAGSPALHELRVGDNHHHVVCRRCGATADIDCVVGERPCLTPSETRGYLLDEAEVTFWGICPTCQEAIEHLRPAPQPATTPATDPRPRPEEDRHD
ncbi:MAG: Fur family transcriptional regulator [Acidimicrobiales bacterium]